VFAQYPCLERGHRVACLLPGSERRRDDTVQKWEESHQPWGGSDHGEIVMALEPLFQLCLLAGDDTFSIDKGEDDTGVVARVDLFVVIRRQ